MSIRPASISIPTPHVSRRVLREYRSSSGMSLRGARYCTRLKSKITPVSPCPSRSRGPVPQVRSHDTGSATYRGEGVAREYPRLQSGLGEASSSANLMSKGVDAVNVLGAGVGEEAEATAVC